MSLAAVALALGVYLHVLAAAVVLAAPGVEDYDDDTPAIIVSLALFGLGVVFVYGVPWVV